MKYLKPKCECGGILRYIEERTHEIASEINRQGGTSEKRCISRRDIGLAGASWLECNLCNNQYEIDYDDNSRIIRGDYRDYN